MQQHQEHTNTIAHTCRSLLPSLRWNHVATFMYDFSRFTSIYFLWFNLRHSKSIQGVQKLSRNIWIQNHVTQVRLRKEVLVEGLYCFMQITWHTISLRKWSSCSIFPLYWDTSSTTHYQIWSGDYQTFMIHRLNISHYYRSNWSWANNLWGNN